MKPRFCLHPKPLHFCVCLRDFAKSRVLFLFDIHENLRPLWPESGSCFGFVFREITTRRRLPEADRAVVALNSARTGRRSAAANLYDYAVARLYGPNCCGCGVPHISQRSVHLGRVANYGEQSFLDGRAITNENFNREADVVSGVGFETLKLPLDGLSRYSLRRKRLVAYELRNTSVAVY